LRFKNLHTGEAIFRVDSADLGSEVLGADHILGSAYFEPASKTVYAFATNRSGELPNGNAGAVSVFYSSDGMKTWKSKKMIVDAIRDKLKDIFNTSVHKGKKLANGTQQYVMAIESGLIGGCCGPVRAAACCYLPLPAAT